MKNVFPYILYGKRKYIHRYFRKAYMEDFRNWYICFKHSPEIEKEMIEALKKMLDKNSKYLVAREIATNGAHKLTDGHHYHFVAQITKKSYTAWLRIFIDKYKLRGLSKDGIARQYGMQLTRDKEVFCTYISKDIENGSESFVATNFDEEDLNRFIKQSYKKFTYESYKFDLFRHLTLTKNDKIEEYGQMKDIPLQLKIIQFHLDQMKCHETLKPIKRNQVVSLSDEYEQRIAKISAEELYDRWF